MEPPSSRWQGRAAARAGSHGVIAGYFLGEVPGLRGPLVVLFLVVI